MVGLKPPPRVRERAPTCLHVCRGAAAGVGLRQHFPLKEPRPTLAKEARGQSKRVGRSPARTPPRGRDGERAAAWPVAAGLQRFNRAGARAPARWGGCTCGAATWRRAGRCGRVLACTRFPAHGTQQCARPACAWLAPGPCRPPGSTPLPLPSSAWQSGASGRVPLPRSLSLPLAWVRSPPAPLSSSRGLREEELTW